MKFSLFLEEQFRFHGKTSMMILIFSASNSIFVMVVKDIEDSYNHLIQSSHNVIFYNLIYSLFSCVYILLFQSDFV
jgi:hypothetical protein